LPWLNASSALSNGDTRSNRCTRDCSVGCPDCANSKQNSALELPGHDDSMKFFERIVKEVLHPLTRHSIDYCVIGGLAIIASGVRRGTADFDIVIPEDKTAQALDILYGNGFRLITDIGKRDDRLSYCRTIEQAIAYVRVSRPSALKMNTGGWDGLFGDIWLRTAVPFQKLRKDASKVRLYGEEVKLASRNDLIKLKKAAGRPVDKVDILELKALAKSRQFPRPKGKT